MEKEILEKIHEIERRQVNIENLLISQKTVLNMDDLVEYTGFSKGYIYILVHQGKIPAHKPTDRTLFFSKKEIDEFLIKKPKTNE